MKIKSIKSKLAIIFIVFLLIAISIIFANNTTQIAKAESNYFKGSGTVDDPFKISTAEDFSKFLNLSQDKHIIAGTSKKYLEASYELTNDIDLSGKSFKTVDLFAGTLDGNEFVISNFKLNADKGNQTSLFLQTTGTLKNMIFNNISIIKTGTPAEVSFLTNENRGLIENITVNGKIMITRHQDNYSNGIFAVSGFCGNNYGTIKKINYSGNGEISISPDKDCNGLASGFVLNNYGFIEDVVIDLSNIALNSYGFNNKVAGLVLNNSSSSIIKNIKMTIGKINVAGEGTQTVGGLVSTGSVNAERCIVNFINDVNVSSASYTKVYFGGILGNGGAHVVDSMVKFEKNLSLYSFKGPVAGGISGEASSIVINSLVQFKNVSIGSYDDYSVKFGGFSNGGDIKNSVVTLDNLSVSSSSKFSKTSLTGGSKLTNVYGYSKSTIDFALADSQKFYCGILDNTNYDSKIKETVGDTSSSDVLDIPFKKNDKLIELLEKWVKKNGTINSQYARWGTKFEDKDVFPYLTYENPFTQLIDGDRLIDGSIDINNPTKLLINNSKVYKWTVYQWSTIHFIQNEVEVNLNNDDGYYDFLGNKDKVTKYLIRATTDQGNSVFFEITIDMEFPFKNEEFFKHNIDFLKTKYYEFNNKYYSTYDEAFENYRIKMLKEKVSEKTLTDESLFAERLAEGEIIVVGKYYRYKLAASSDYVCFFNYENLIAQIERDFGNDVKVNYIKDPNQKLQESMITDNMFDSVVDVDGVKAYLVKDFSFKRDDCVTVILSKYQSDEKIKIAFDLPLSQQIDDFGGIYSVFESDEAGNVTEYNIYKDNNNSSMNVNFVNKGKEQKDVDIFLVSFNGGSYFYDRLDINALSDIDRQSIIKINYKGKTSYINLKEDNLPSFIDNGVYEILIFDRSKNKVKFTITIANEEPQVSFSESNSELNIAINKLNNFNKITIELDKQLQVKDDVGNSIAKDRFDYRFKRYGNFVVKILDKYNNEHRFTYNFELNNDDTEPENPTQERDYSIYVGNNKVKTFKTTNQNVKFTKKSGSNAYFHIKNDRNVKLDYSWGDIISIEGVYKVVILSTAGNLHLTFTIDKTAPTGILANVENGGKTQNEVNLSWREENATAEIFKDGKKAEKQYKSSSKINEAGKYEIKLKDEAGNITQYKFEIDMSVDYAINIPNRLITNDVVKVIANEKMTIEVFNNDLLIATKHNSFDLKLSGNYKIKLIDEFKNIAEYEFVIISSPQQKFDYTLPDNYVFIEVFGSEEQNKIEEQSLQVTKDGTYEIVYDNTKTGERRKIDVTIDTVAPIVNIEGVENGGSTEELVKVFCDEKNINVQLKRNGKLIDYKLGQVISSDGAFEVVVSDQAGNCSILNFNRIWKMNDSGKVAITGGGITLVGLIIELIRKRGVKLK